MSTVIAEADRKTTADVEGLTSEVVLTVKVVLRVRSRPHSVNGEAVQSGKVIKVSKASHASDISRAIEEVQSGIVNGYSSTGTERHIAEVNAKMGLPTAQREQVEVDWEYSGSYPRMKYADQKEG